MTSKTFYCVTSEKGNNKVSNRLLEEACVQRGVEFVKVGENYDWFSLPKPKKGDMVYRVARSYRARMVQHQLMSDDTIHFGIEPKQRYNEPLFSHIVLENAGVAVPLSVPLTTTNIADLQKVVKQLGLPLVVKVLGGTHGKGVIKVDSFESLVSLVDFIESSDDRFVLQKYIDNAGRHARLIVLGDQVVSSIEYRAKAGDFRSNARGMQVVAKDFSDEVVALAVSACRALGLDFGGVDVITDKEGCHFVLEVNSPCYFPRCQLTTGDDVAGQMIDYLLNKG